MDGKVAVIGGSDFVMPFAALGLDTYPVSGETEDIKKSAKEILDGNYALVVVAENIAEAADEVLAVRQKNATPCVLVVPFTTESEGYATQSLGHALRMATGIDILQNN